MRRNNKRIVLGYCAYTDGGCGLPDLVFEFGELVQKGLKKGIYRLILEPVRRRK